MKPTLAHILLMSALLILGAVSELCGHPKLAQVLYLLGFAGLGGLLAYALTKEEREL